MAFAISKSAACESLLNAANFHIPSTFHSNLPIDLMHQLWCRPQKSYCRAGLGTNWELTKTAQQKIAAIWESELIFNELVRTRGLEPPRGCPH